MTAQEHRHIALRVTHIACDADTRSEIVVPLFRDGALVGVFDLDSPRPGRFDEIDRAGLESVAEIFLAAL
ncbi:GAF domain-containing protein [Nocardia asiatica]